MSLIVLHTRIKAQVERCFLLSLSVDVHMSSTAKTRERAVAGITAGMMQLNDTVTWRARHFGIMQELSSRITVCERPRRFVDEMVKGPFKHIRHEHVFEALGKDETLMTDHFEFSAPLGFLGKIAEALFLKPYLKKSSPSATITSGKWQKAKPGRVFFHSTNGA